MKTPKDFRCKSLIQLYTESVTEKWYHGSNIKFDKFKYKTGTLLDPSYTSPIFLTSDRNFAKAYAGYGTPYIYTVEVLPNINIMDFRKLPDSNDIYNNYTNTKEFKLGKSLLSSLERKYKDNGERLYNNTLDGDYSSIEDTVIYEWLKKNRFDGAYIIETKALNLLIFDASNIKIVSVELVS